MKYDKEKQIFRDFLKKKNLKRTEQRDIILETFLKLEGHISPEDFYQKLRKKHPDIGLSTVYRTLKLFSECELAREVQRRDGGTLFEHEHEHPHHDHMLCSQCGRYFEFYDDLVERLQEDIAHKHNFKMTGHNLEIFGICSGCQTEQE
ncbi:MAG: transcriptional repressor [Firmicutes bacterium]|nr:transcriptional repressor [Bacillota bacterium]